VIFPATSEPVQVTVVMPAGKRLLVGGTHVACWLFGQLSMAKRVVGNTTLTGWPPDVNRSRSPGVSRSGGCVSFTVRGNEHSAALPDASVAAQLTVVVPTGN
jgi:hypothetical protein